MDTPIQKYEKSWLTKPSKNNFVKSNVMGYIHTNPVCESLLILVWGCHNVFMDITRFVIQCGVFIFRQLCTTGNTLQVLPLVVYLLLCSTSCEVSTQTVWLRQALPLRIGKDPLTPPTVLTFVNSTVNFLLILQWSSVLESSPFTPSTPVTISPSVTQYRHGPCVVPGRLFVPPEVSTKWGYT